MSKEIMRLPKFQMDKGIVDTYEVFIGTDPFGHPVILDLAFMCSKWQDTEDFDWSKRILKDRKDYPVCWTLKSLARYLDKTNLKSTSGKVFLPKAYFSKAGTLPRKTKCILFCNYALSSGVVDTVNKFKDQFEKENIAVFSVSNMWSIFSLNGLPVSDVEWQEAGDVFHNGREFPTLLDHNKFIGGKVMVISDFDTSAGGAINYQRDPGTGLDNYTRTQTLIYNDRGGDTDLEADILADLDQIPDCIKSFAKINNYVYSFNRAFEDEDFGGIAVIQANNDDDYFVFRPYTVTTAEYHNSAAYYSKAKADLHSDIADFFGLVVP